MRYRKPVADAASRARRTARDGALLVLAPLVGITAPLVFHDSGASGPFGWSARYAAFVAAVAVGVAVTTALVARVCGRRGDRTVAAGVAVVLVVTLTTLAVCEGVLRVLEASRVLPDPFADYAGWGQRRAMLFGYENEPNSSWERAGATYSTDARGFRTRVGRHADEVTAKHRVVVIGESSVFGYGLDDDETWPEHLERRLNERRPGTVWVANAGDNGHVSLQTMMRYYLRVAPAEPTHVVLYAARNDVAYLDVPEDALPLTEAILLAPTLSAYQQTAHARSNVYARTLLWRFVEGATRGDPLAPPPPPQGLGTEAHQEKIVRQATERFRRHVLTLADMTRRDGVQLVLVTFLQVADPWVDRQVRGFNQILRDVAAELSLPLVDLERAFEREADKPSFFFHDLCHPNEKGARYIADAVAASLDRLLPSRRTPAAASAPSAQTTATTMPTRTPGAR